MNNVKPTDLTELQWLLLRQLNKYSNSFYTEFVYAQFSKNNIDRPTFYQMFFSLAAFSYIKLAGYGVLVQGQKQDFYYVVTPKGKKTVAQHTQTLDEDNLPLPVTKKSTKPIVLTNLSRTVTLQDYSFRF